MNKIVNEYYDKTCIDNIPRARLWEPEGEESVESAMKAVVLVFHNTATVPTIRIKAKLQL